MACRAISGNALAIGGATDNHRSTSDESRKHRRSRVVLIRTRRRVCPILDRVWRTTWLCCSLSYARRWNALDMAGNCRAILQPWIIHRRKQPPHGRLDRHHPLYAFADHPVARSSCRRDVAHHQHHSRNGNDEWIRCVRYDALGVSHEYQGADDTLAKSECRAPVGA